MQIKIVCFGQPEKKLKDGLQALFDIVPQKQQAIDLRRTPVSLLVKSGLVSLGAAKSLLAGRKWHHELSSRGAVGIAQANRIAMEDDPTVPLLLCEEDLVIHNQEFFRRDVRLAQSSDFDLVVFGFLPQGSVKRLLDFPDGWVEIGGMFHLLHAVYVSPRGRKVIGKYLRSHPLEMQIDSRYGSMAEQGLIRVAGTLNGSVGQKVHRSSIQEITGTCLLCIVPPRPWKTIGLLVLLLMLWCKGGSRCSGRS